MADGVEDQVPDFEDDDDLEARVRAEVKGKEDENLKLNRAYRKRMLDEMNRKHAVISNYGGRCLVLDFQPNAVYPGLYDIELTRVGDFKARYCNQLLTAVSGEKSRRELGDWWFRHANRRQYETLVMEPGGEGVIGKGGRLYYNLWQGWGVEPKPGDWGLMRQHVREVLANGDAEAAEYIERWAAWALQNPGRPAEMVLAFQGEEGAGKGVFARAVQACFGLHGLHVTDQEHFTGKFNKHLRHCILLFLDEAFWAGDRRAEGKLKGLVTEPTVLIEGKGVDAVQMRNLLHIIMATNSEWVVPAGHNPRRYSVFRVSDERVGDKGYFAALYEQMKGGGVAAMMHDLLATDLGGWHPREGYWTEALQKQQERTLKGVPAFIEWILQEGVVPGSVSGFPSRVLFSRLYGAFLKFDPTVYHVSQKAFADELTKFGIINKKASDAKYRDFAVRLGEARRIFEARLGGREWNWEEPGAEWMQYTLTEMKKRGEL